MQLCVASCRINSHSHVIIQSDHTYQKTVMTGWLLINPSWTKSALVRRMYQEIHSTAAIYVHVLTDFRHLRHLRHYRNLSLNRFVTCPSSLRSSVFRKMSNLGLRLCGSIPEHCLGHSVFEIVDVLRRVCNQDRYRTPTISIVHRLRLFFLLLVSTVIASQSCMLKVSSTFSSSIDLSISMMFCSMMLSFNEVVFNLCLDIELLFDELEQILINYVLYLVMIVSVKFFAFIANRSASLP